MQYQIEIHKLSVNFRTQCVLKLDVLIMSFVSGHRTSDFQVSFRSSLAQSSSQGIDEADTYDSSTLVQ